MTQHLSLGIAAALGPDLAARIAPAAEHAGLHALWVNDTPGGDALEVLAAAAAVTERLVLATGVLPVDRRSPRAILSRVAQLGLPEERLVLGIGSGAISKGALDAVADAAAALQSGTTGAGTTARVVVGALGPRMRRLGAEASDGLLLSWLTPELAAVQAEEAHAIDPSAHVALYVRTAVDPSADARLDIETARYGGYPAYAANFERLGIAAADTVIRPLETADRLAAYRDAADEIVLRAITPDDSESDLLQFIDSVSAAARA
ncbi:MAG: LLM class flavin-dependent oxidoreductase [Microbacterium sp.]